MELRSWREDGVYSLEHYILHSNVYHKNGEAKFNPLTNSNPTINGVYEDVIPTYFKALSASVMGKANAKYRALLTGIISQLTQEGKI